MYQASLCVGKDFFCCMANKICLEAVRRKHQEGRMLRGDKTRGFWVLLLFLLTGALLGGLLGEIVAETPS